MGPGPVPVPASVTEALGAGMLGHLDPLTVECLEETSSLLREIFGTQNEHCLAPASAGSGAMAAALTNLIEPNDKVLVCAFGLFGRRAADMAERMGANVTVLEAPWQQPFDASEIAAALDREKPKILHLTHGETSAGIMLHDPAEFATLGREAGALVVLDSVATLGGVPVQCDAMGIDVCYSGGQKALSGPPGISPVTFGPRALEAFVRRKEKPTSWYFDLELMWNYWGPAHGYHYTMAVNLLFGLREALRAVSQEGLEARWARHRRNSEAMQAGLVGMGMTLGVAPEHRMTTLLATETPDGVDAEMVRKRMFDVDGIEVGGGFGAVKGRLLRIGQMGMQANEEPVRRTLASLRAGLIAQGYDAPDPTALVDAAYAARA